MLTSKPEEIAPTIAMSHSSTTSFKLHRNWTLNTLLVVLAIVTYVPFVFILVASFKNNQQYFTQFWLPTFPLHFENYIKAWPTMFRSIVNSFGYSLPTTILVLSISGLAGYGFARFRFPGKEPLFLSVLALLMLPSILLVIPMFVQIVQWGWINTPQGIIFPWSAIEVVFGIFLLRTSFETLPKSYFEAARIDGANELQLFYRIAVPLAAPAFGTLAILNLLFDWNDIVWPLVAILDNNRYPVSISVQTFTSSTNTDYGAVFASYVLASLPLMIIFAFTARRSIASLQGGLVQ